MDLVFGILPTIWARRIGACQTGSMASRMSMTFPRLPDGSVVNSKVRVPWLRTGIDQPHPSVVASNACVRLVPGAEAMCRRAVIEACTDQLPPGGLRARGLSAVEEVQCTKGSLAMTELRVEPTINAAKHGSFNCRQYRGDFLCGGIFEETQIYPIEKINREWKVLLICLRYRFADIAANIQSPEGKVT